MNNLIVFLLIGLLAGWLAGKIMKGKDFGLVGNMIVGVIGALIGGYLFDVFNISTAGMGIIGPILTALVGALVLLYLIRLVKKA